MFLELVTGPSNETPTRATRYLDLNLPLDTTAQLRISPGGVEDLRYDADGDGDFESMVVATASLTGEAALDIEAPTVTFNEQSARTSVTIELTASDNSSGVRIVRYSFDGLTFEQYSAPLQIDPYQVRTVFAFADDNAGNRSAIATYDVPQPPSITAPPDLTIETAATELTCGVTVSDEVLGDATAGSNSLGTVAVTREGIPANNLFPVGTTQITYTATDSNGLIATAVQTVAVLDKTPPTLECPASFSIAFPTDSSDTSMVVSYPMPLVNDNCSALTVTANQASGSLFLLGPTLVIATATDRAGNTASCSFTVSVIYRFAGFFAPVNNLPTLNSVNAGRAIPIKFTLSGDKGLDVLAANPGSASIACNASTEVELTDTISAGGSSLSYDAAADQYIYVWKTEPSWVGSCRQFMIQLNDGTIHRANFRFK